MSRATLVSANRLSSKFVDATKKLLGPGSEPLFQGKGAEYPKARGMTFTVGSTGSPSYSPEKVLDLAKIGESLAQTSGKMDEAQTYREVIKDATSVVTEEQMLSSFADYQDSLVGLNMASGMLEDVSQQIHSGMSGGIHLDDGWVDRVKNSLANLQKTVESALERVVGVFKDKYYGLEVFGSHVKELIDSIGLKAKDAVVFALQKVFHSLSALAARVISTFFGWIAAVKTIAADKGFSLNKVSVKISGFSFKSVGVLGFNIPVPQISTPEVDMDFESPGKKQAPTGQGSG